jgi:hypothetical protein
MVERDDLYDFFLFSFSSLNLNLGIDDIEDTNDDREVQETFRIRMERLHDTTSTNLYMEGYYFSFLLIYPSKSGSI